MTTQYHSLSEFRTKRVAPKKINGVWGVRWNDVPLPPFEVGDIVTVTTRAGKSWHARIDEVFSDGREALASRISSGSDEFRCYFEAGSKAIRDGIDVEDAYAWANTMVTEGDSLLDYYLSESAAALHEFERQAEDAWLRSAELSREDEFAFPGF